MDDLGVVVIDNGSYETKIGIAGDDAPREDFPTVIGLARGIDPMHPSGWNKVGWASITTKGIHKRHHPINEGVIKIMPCMDKIWHECFYQLLRVAPEENAILLTEKTWNPPSVRENMTSIMFETFDAGGLCLASDAVLSLIGFGSLTGVAVNMGHHLFSSTAVYEGHALPYTTTKLPYGGKAIREYFLQCVNQTQPKGKEFLYNSDRESIYHALFRVGYVPLNCADEERKQLEQAEYELPCGEILKVGDDRFRCLEALFDPSRMNRGDKGLIAMIQETLNKIIPDEDSHPISNAESSLFSTLPGELISSVTSYLPRPLKVSKEFAQNIGLEGNTATLKGVAERVRKEFEGISIAGTPTKIRATTEGKNITWVGGSIIGSLSTFQQQMITRAEYQETGSAIIHAKCYT